MNRGKYEVTTNTSNAASKRKRMLMAEKLKSRNRTSVHIDKHMDNSDSNDVDDTKRISRSKDYVHKKPRIRSKDESSSSDHRVSESESENMGKISFQNKAVRDKMKGYSDSDSSESSDENTGEKSPRQNDKSEKKLESNSSDSSSENSGSEEEAVKEHLLKPPKKRKLSNENVEAGEGSSSESSDSDGSDEDGKDDDHSSKPATNEEETPGLEEYDAIRKEIANMPFEELQKLRDKVGSKVYHQALFGKNANGTGKKRMFKRENKNRPMEVTSKAPVPRYRQMQAKKAKVTRDPRFDDLSGTYNEERFKKSYGFLDELKVREKTKLQKKMKKEQDPDKVFHMNYLVNRMTQQEKSNKEKEKRLELSKEIKKKEKGLVEEGKTPFYLKKSEKRKLELAEKFRELKKSGKLDKYLNRKRKKTASKDRKHLPKMHSR